MTALKNGVVVAPQPPAAEAGAAILRAGGNAFDAAVATVLMQTVTDPFMCGVAGLGNAVLHDAASGEQIALDFLGRIGSLAKPDQWADKARKTPAGKDYVESFINTVGYQAILTPSTVAGLAAIHTGRGKLPWRELVQPAIDFLRNGMPLYAYIADYFQETHQYPYGGYFPPFNDYIHTTPAFADLWLRPDGTVKQVGDHLENPDYLATLETLAAEGPESFYRGSLAAKMAADLAAHDAYVTADDIANCRAISLRPLRSTYRDYTLVTTPVGGVTVLQILNLLGQHDVAAWGPQNLDYLDFLAKAMRISFGEREPLSDQTKDEVLDRMLSQEVTDQLREKIEAGAAAKEAVASPGTTHCSVADSAGNVAAITHTLSLGSGVVTKGLGFQYNNGMGGFDPTPGKPKSIEVGRARVTPMAPTIALKNGQPYCALGSPGSNAIVTAIVQVLVNLIDFQMTPEQAVSVPRLHCEGGAVMLENRTPATTAAALAERGHELKPRAFSYDSLQGRVQLLVREGDHWHGASDPRRDGGVAAYAD